MNMEGSELPEAARGLRMVLCLINSGLVLAGEWFSHHYSAHARVSAN